ncbi:uncharacterized protein B0H64DRAFT_89404 [Chaetomium fimeti]|uniref:Uncharacterized protein n=1 Tax=Chaetomium fimeti TaxID=1854472 RepID=A0AAE0LVN8_9PEZI|nr:hypothetical protein B0H64DRAFT_89404 [Chaetomium fimeti]
MHAISRQKVVGILVGCETWMNRRDILGFRNQQPSVPLFHGPPRANPKLPQTPRQRLSDPCPCSRSPFVVQGSGLGFGPPRPLVNELARDGWRCIIKVHICQCRQNNHNALSMSSFSQCQPEGGRFLLENPDGQAWDHPSWAIRAALRKGAVVSRGKDTKASLGELPCTSMSMHRIRPDCKLQGHRQGSIAGSGVGPGSAEGSGVEWPRSDVGRELKLDRWPILTSETWFVTAMWMSCRCQPPSRPVPPQGASVTPPCSSPVQTSSCGCGPRGPFDACLDLTLRTLSCLSKHWPGKRQACRGAGKGQRNPKGPGGSVKGRARGVILVLPQESPLAYKMGSINAGGSCLSLPSRVLFPQPNQPASIDRETGESLTLTT